MTEPLIVSIDYGNNVLRCYSIAATEVFDVQLYYLPSAVDCSATEIFIGGYTPSQICVFAFSGQCLQTIPTDSIPYSISVHKSGSKFACGLGNGMLAVYDKADDNMPLTRLWQASEEPITALAWLSDEEICSSTQGGSIITWNAESSAQIKLIQSEGPQLRCLSPISSDRRFIFSGYHNGIVRRHNLEDGSNIEAKAHVAGIYRFCFNDDMMVTCSYDRTVAAFDIESLAEKWRYECVNFASSIVVVNEEVFVGVRCNFIVVLNIHTGEFVRQFDRGHEGYVRLAVQSTEAPFARFKFED